MDADGWIERALLRVEALETERARCAAASGDPQAALRSIELDAEIEALVEALESAGEAESGVATRSEHGAPVGHTTIAEPFVRSDDTAPMHVALDPATSLHDEPLAWRRRRFMGPALVAAIAVALVGLGAAVLDRNETAGSAAASGSATSPAAAAPERIVAVEVPPDTQEPEVARGADVDATPPTAIPEAPVTVEAPKPSPKKTASRSKRKTKKRKKTKDRSVAFGRSRDPLSGMK
jgi:hypothetical protein